MSKDELSEEQIVQQDGRFFVKTADGELLEMHGCGGAPFLDIDPRIDLCQPIYEQAQRLWAEDAKLQAEQSGEAA